MKIKLHHLKESGKYYTTTELEIEYIDQYQSSCDIEDHLRANNLGMDVYVDHPDLVPHLFRINFLTEPKQPYKKLI